MNDELARAAEALADAVELHVDGELAVPLRPQRSEYEEGEDGQQEFEEALELWEYDSELRRTTLERALERYRRAEERAICERAMAHCNGTAAVANPKLSNPRKRAEKGTRR